MPILRPLSISLLLSGLIGISSGLHGYFNSISLTGGSHPAASSSSSSSSDTGDSYNTVINHIEVKQTDPLTLQWLIEKSQDGPIEHLNIVKKNKGYFEQLLRNHIQELQQKKLTHRGFTSKSFISNAFLAVFCAITTELISCPIGTSILEQYRDVNPHSFAVIPALIACAAPIGLVLSTYAGIQSIKTYQDRLDARILRDLELLARLQRA